MVVPNRHVASLSALTVEERREAMDLLAQAEKVLKKAIHAQGFNMGMNLGKVAGAGIEDHAHFHLVPRWLADTNFWPIIAETKTLPQHLRKTYDLIKRYWRFP